MALWRLAANTPAINDDGLPGMSANDLAAPALTFVLLILYADPRTPRDPSRYHQARAPATLAAIPAAWACPGLAMIAGPARARGDGPARSPASGGLA